MKPLALIASTFLLSLTVFSVQAGDHGDDKSGKIKKKHHSHMAARIKKADTNEDGKISRDEFLAHAEQRFAKMDTNGDGFVTAEEGKAAHKKMRQEHKQRVKERRQQKADANNE